MTNIEDRDTENKEPAVQADGLGRDYGEVRALEGLDLHVPRGSLVGLLGPNGAGKTTAMLLLATLLRPSRGVARVFGHDCAREPKAVRRRLGLAFHEPSIDGLLTVEENLYFAARLAGLGGATANHAVRDALARTGLEGRAKQPARQLSAGWRRLADIARATLHSPDLLILDEPTVGLDPEHREQTWQLLETERRTRHTSILFSTHYLAEAESCDHVVLLANGRVVSTGTPAALKASVGAEMVEVEGAGASRFVSALSDRVTVRTQIQTTRGFRVGVEGSRDELAGLASVGSGVDRFSIRPVTLDDVYFARALTPVSPVPGTST